MPWALLLKMRSKSYESVTEFRMSNNRQINWHESRIEEVATEVLSARLVANVCIRASYACISWDARVATRLISLTNKATWLHKNPDDKNKVSIVRDRAVRMTFVSFSGLFLYCTSDFFVAYANYGNIPVYFSRGRNHFTVS